MAWQDVAVGRSCGGLEHSLMKQRLWSVLLARSGIISELPIIRPQTLPVSFPRKNSSLISQNLRLVGGSHLRNT